MASGRYTNAYTAVIDLFSSQRDLATTVKGASSSLLLVLYLSLLVACAPKHNKRPFIKNIRGFEILVGQVANDIEDLWGPNGVLVAGAKDYVKYYDRYQTRSHINFDGGVITVETLTTTDPKSYLHTAIVNTLLMSETASNHLVDDTDVPVGQHPFLYKQVLDQTRQPISSRQRAGLFADHLLSHKLRKRTVNFRSIWAVTIPLVANHLDKRAHQYLRTVRRAARQYNVDASLILAIIQTESSFNPYAVTSSNALGLMQVIPDSAGRDVFSRIKNRRGKPTRRYLFNPQKNIDTGTAYLHLLYTVYLAKITDPITRRYAVISAYNSGIGSVLRIFSVDRHRAISLINQLAPDQVYQALLTRHPSTQARRYLHKVNNAHQHYLQGLLKLSYHHPPLTHYPEG